MCVCMYELEKKEQGYERDFPVYKKLKDQVCVWIHEYVRVCINACIRASVFICVYAYI